MPVGCRTKPCLRRDRAFRAHLERSEGAQGTADPRGSYVARHEILDGPALREPLNHSTTSSTEDRKVGEMVNPSRLAVFMLSTDSNRTDCMTGMSAGFAPFKMRAI